MNYFNVDGHWNARGRALVANILYDKLLTAGL